MIDRNMNEKKNLVNANLLSQQSFFHVLYFRFPLLKNRTKFSSESSVNFLYLSLLHQDDHEV